jgi:hypothetical protein
MTMSKVDVHKKICEELNALYARKNADYGDSFGKSFNEYGLTMACIRLEDKLNRIKALRNKDAQVADESITDTLMDLANYSIMTLVEMTPQKGDHDTACALSGTMCQCFTCKRDGVDCSCYDVVHAARECPTCECPDYVPEEG